MNQSFEEWVNAQLPVADPATKMPPDSFSHFTALNFFKERCNFPRFCVCFVQRTLVVTAWSTFYCGMVVLQFSSYRRGERVWIVFQHDGCEFFCDWKFIILNAYSSTTNEKHTKFKKDTGKIISDAAQKIDEPCWDDSPPPTPLPFSTVFDTVAVDVDSWYVLAFFIVLNRAKEGRRSIVKVKNVWEIVNTHKILQHQIFWRNNFVLRVNFLKRSHLKAVSDRIVLLAQWSIHPSIDWLISSRINPFICLVDGLIVRLRKQHWVLEFQTFLTGKIKKIYRTRVKI